MILPAYFEKNIKLIDRALDKCLPKKAARPDTIHDAMRYSVFSGGKRIRPILVLESTRATKGDMRDALLLACAIEMIHTYSLIHDDLPSMDNDDMRRGKPSCHIKYGEATAILAGDALLTLAFNTIAGIKNKRNLSEIILELSGAIGTSGMIGGQAMDLKARDNSKTDLPTIEYINIRKTGSLIAAALKIGAIVSNARQKEVKALAAYGENIGLAFQIIDDMLDGEGYAEILGISAAREEAEALNKRAKEALDIFGKRAVPLKEIADFVIKRKM
ncbi:MAG: polyprenyl synthetase family protein [Candidatus Omnitrophota bacterium]|nr:polyprenyl synthetase family protein [Candidatus Omnitrophota bacterium]